VSARQLSLFHRKSTIFFVMAATLAAVTALRYLLDPILGETYPYTLFIFPAIYLANSAGWKAGVVALLVGMMIACFLFIAPRMSFRVESQPHQVGLLINLAVGGAGIYLADARRKAQTRAEAALRRNEELYLELIETIPALVWVWEATGKPALHNRRWYEYTGKTPDNCKDDYWHELIHPDDAEETIATWGRCKASGKPYTHEYRLRRADGEYRWILSRKTATRSPNGIDRWVGIITDIDDRKRTEEELKEKQTLIGVASRIGRFGAWSVELPGMKVTWSEELRAIHGLPPDQSPGVEEGLNFYAPQYRDAMREVFFACIQSGVPFDVEVQIETVQGRKACVRVLGEAVRGANGEITRVHGAFQDISDRKRVEEALLLRDRAIGAATQGIVITDAGRPDNPITYVSPGFERMTGYGSADILGRNCRFLQGEGTDTATIALLRESIRAGKACTVELLNYRKDGTPFWNELSISPVLDAGGRLTHFVGVQADVTDRIRAEKTFRFQHSLLRCQTEASPDGILVVGPDFRILSYNRRFLDVWGIPDELVAAGDDAAILSRAKSLTADPEGFAKRVAAIYADMETESQDEVLLADGRTLDRYSGIINGPGGEVLGRVWYFRDITERKRSERAQAERARLASLVGDVGLAWSRGESLRGILQLCTEAVVRHLGAAFARIWTLNADENILELQASAGMYTHLDGQHGRVPMGKFKIGLIAQERRPHLTNSVIGDPRVGDQDWAVREGMVAFAGYPLLVGSRLKGVVALFAKEALSETTLMSLQAIADQIAIGIDRKRREGELRLFRALIDHTTDGIEVIDPETGRFLDVNEQSCITHGYSREELLGLGVSDVDLTVAASTWSEVIGNVRRGGFLTFESRHRRKDGSTFTVEISPNAIQLDRKYIVAVVRDITERKRTEEALQSSQHRLRHVIGCSPAVLFTLAIADDQILGINWISDNLREMLGYLPGEAYAPEWWPANIHPDDIEGVFTQTRVVLFELDHSTHEFRFKHRNGKYRWTRGEIRLVRDAGGLLLDAVGSWSDITERKQIEEQYQQAQKMEAFGQLAGGVAHDFNNLLTIINGYCEHLLDGMSDTNPMRGPLEAIWDAGERAAGLTSQLLAFSRQTVLEPVILDPNTVVTETTKLLKRLIGEDIRLSASLDPRIGRILVDPGQLGQVLMNLAVNARDAMPTGGRLTIETRNIVLDEASIEGREVRPGRYVMIAVSDTGSGMTAEVKSRVFEPFFTTKETGKGTGLGLATVCGNIKQSGGHVEVYSELGVGTTFKIYLPTIEDVETTLAPGLPARIRGGTETVLLVEDQADVRQLALIALQMHGYTVIEAADGSDVFRQIDLSHPHLDILVTDVVMPGMSGRQVTESLRQQYPGIKVLYTSGYTDDAVVRHGILQADVAFLRKPYTPFSLVRKVREVLDQV
jgi:PAS domain S-box-containing protein